MCLVPDMRSPQHQHPEQTMGVPAAVVARRCRVPTASKPVMIGRPQPKKIAEVSRANRLVRRTHSRRPDADLLREPEYFPHICNNCGHAFIPRGFVSEFCGGECRHSFAFFRHMEKRKIAQQQLRRQQQQQQQQQRQQGQQQQQQHQQR